MAHFALAPLRSSPGTGMDRPMRFRSVTVLAMLGVAMALTGADEKTRVGSPAFQEVWEKHKAGKPAAALFQKILADESAATKDRFNSAYVLAVIALSENRPDDAIGFLDRADEILPE